MTNKLPPALIAARMDEISRKISELTADMQREYGSGTFVFFTPDGGMYAATGNDRFAWSTLVGDFKVGRSDA